MNIRKPKARGLISFILSFQLAALPILTSYSSAAFAHRDPPDEQAQNASAQSEAEQLVGAYGTDDEAYALVPEAQKLVNILSTQDLRNPKFIGADPDHLTQQVHRVLNPDGSVASEYPLHKVDIQNPLVGYNVSDIKMVYRPEVREFALEKVFTPKAKGKEPVTQILDQHVYTNMQLTSNAVEDDNVIMFATPEGVRLILKPMLYAGMFAAPTPAPIVLPLPAETGLTITALKIVERGDQGQKAGNLNVTVTNREGASTVVTITKGEIVLAAKQRLSITNALVQIANGDIKSPMKMNEMLSTLADLNAELRVHANNLSDDPVTAEKLREALTNIGQGAPAARMSVLLAADSNGSTSFDRLANANRDTWTEEEANADREMIERFRADNPDSKLSNREILTQLERENLGFDAPKEFKKSAWSRIKASLTPGRLVITGAVLGGIGLDYVSGDASKVMILNALSWTIQMANHVPLVNLITDTIVKKDAMNMLKENWAVARAAAGLGVTLIIYPLSFWVGGAIARMKGENLPPIKAFFTIGLRSYVVAGFPFLQKGFWEKLLKQKNLYKSIEIGNLSRHSINSPLASQETIDRNADRINDKIKADADAKTRAMLIAAQVISQQEGVDVASLLMVGFGKQVATLADMNLQKDPVEFERWQRLTAAAQTEKARIAVNGNGEVNAEDLRVFESKFSGIAQQIKTVQAVKKNPFVSYLKEKSMIFGKWVSGNILFGLPGLNNYRQFSQANIDDHTSEIAHEAYRDDFIFSEGMYALVDPVGFADVTRLGPNAPRILADNGEQAAIYGAQGAVDPLTAARPEGLKLPDDQQPLSNSIFSDQWARKQTFIESIKAIVKSIKDPNATSFFDNHKNYLKNTVEGFQVRLLIGGAFRTFALWLPFAVGTGLLTTHSLINVPYFIGLAGLIESWFLLAKISFNYGAAGFFPGYATVWPYIHLMGRFAKESAAKNLIMIQNADYFLDTGLKMGDEEMMRKGVDLVLANYQASDEKLAKRYLVPSSEYSAVMANALLEYSRNHIPLPTDAKDTTFSRVSNMGLGAAMSTALYALISTSAYHELDWHSNFEMLRNSLMFFGATYVGLEAASQISKYFFGKMSEREKVKLKLAAEAHCEDDLTHIGGVTDPAIKEIIENK